MDIDLSTYQSLIEQNRALIQQIEKLKLQIEEQSALLRWYEERFRLEQHRKFGASSERIHPDQQKLIFNDAEVEAELGAASVESQPEFENITYQRRKTNGQRQEKLDNLPKETVEYRLPEEEQICPQCGGPLHEMSTQVRREIIVIPASVKTVEHISYVYACRNCERTAEKTPIITAPMPAPVIPGSFASPSAIAHIISQKFCEGLPLYRQEKQFERFNFNLSRQTMANWILKGSDLWLAPLYKQMKSHLLKRDILHADETTLEVLHEPNRAPQTQSYMWIYCSGRGGPPIILFDYQTTRSGEHARQFLDGFKGYLHVDGYSGYDSIPGAILVGCWSHARRKFNEALKALSTPASSSYISAQTGMDYCNRLFAIEKYLHDASPIERKAAREARSKPVLEQFKKWLDEQSEIVLPKGYLGRAIVYCRNQWEKLTRFLEDGRLEISNNLAERGIKPFVIGRKNWLFANTPLGARASAICYSIVETAKANGLNPYAYLTYIFEQLPNLKSLDEQSIDEFLPWSETIPAHCRVKAKP